ncbi:copper transporter [Arcanobacterium bovis]|uniref:Copper transporter n=1 Tax=Arcanobacterium bovis TaxID=2529275 RepID=A0A4Q9V1R8_9ACTO|nr:copper transporter [Arcanobacterium bovis]TBW23015.1 copper transporter [Arcanobacterium bovis]
MVDFRYHLVSLVAVFLALSVGIILGAGPLQNSIGEALSGEVSSLRDTNMSLKADNEALKAMKEHQEVALLDASPLIIGGTLSGSNVAVVVLPGTPKETVDSAVELIGESGAKVSGVVAINSVWTEAKQTSFRSAFAEQIKSYITNVGDTNDINTILALALNQIVRNGSTHESNKTLFDLMSASEQPMISVKSGVDKPAQAIVVLTPDNDATGTSKEKKDAETEAQADYDVKTFSSLVSTLTSKSPTVVAGAANSKNDIVVVVRTAGTDVSTVDSIDSATGLINIPLAVAAELSNKTVHYGFGDTASKVLGDRIVVPAPQPAPAS